MEKEADGAWVYITVVFIACDIKYSSGSLILNYLQIHSI